MAKLSGKERIGIFIAILVVAFFFLAGGVAAFLLSDEATSPMIRDSGHTQTPSLQIETIREGDGAQAQPGDELTVHYVGRLQNGQIFDSSRERDEPISFTLGNGEVITGWDLGLQGMRVGETRMLTIPPQMAYGAEGAGPIPPNATLEFEVELVRIAAGA